MYAQRAVEAYSRVGLETGVAAASPHRLILMLYDGALRAVADATAHLAAGRIPDKGHAISSAIGIVQEGLMASVDTKQGGVIAEQLLQLYDYISHRLLLTSLRNDAAGLAEVTALLQELRGAWAAIDQTPAERAGRTELATA